MKKEEKKKTIALCDYPTTHHYNAIDVVKFLCAFLIVMIHVKPFNTTILDYDSLSYINFGLKNFICRIAVPFYFVTSGFLLFRKIDLNNVDTDRIKIYCFKILRLLGIWTFLLFVGKNPQLWYLGALVLAVLLITYLLKKNIKFSYLIIIAIILYIIGLLGDSYYSLIEPLKNISFFHYIMRFYEICFANTRNGLFFGFIFVLMGVMFAKKNIRINKVISIIGFIVSMILLFGEVYLLKQYSHPKDYNLLIFLIPAVFFLFNLVGHIELKDREIYGKLRIIGMLIFYSHMFINFFVVFGIKMIGRYYDLNLGVFNFILTVLFALIFAIIIERLSKTKRFSWLKYLYS